MAKANDKQKEEQQQAADLPAPAFGRGDVPAERDMSRYAGQQEAQHAIENDMPPWADFKNADGSWHINQQYRGGVPDWWRDHTTNKTRDAMNSYLNEYEALQKRLAELGQGNAAGMPPGTTGTPGYGGGGTFRPEMPGQPGGFTRDAYSSNVQGFLNGQNFANQYEMPRASAAMYGPGTGAGSANVQNFMAAQPMIQQYQAPGSWAQRYTPQQNASFPPPPPQQQAPPQSRYQMFIPTAGAQGIPTQAWNPWGGPSPMSEEEQRQQMALMAQMGIFR